MKFDPGDKDAKVKVAQYSTDIAHLFKKFGKAVSLVCATSDYLGKNGSIRAKQSPYYFLILGNGPQVASVRNQISKSLDGKGHFVDNIETGFDYDRAPFTFGIPNRCTQIDHEPSFSYFEEPQDGDTCTIKINVPLDNFRWIVRNKEIFEKSFTVKSLNGSDVNIVSDSIDEKDPIAMVDLHVYNMFDNYDVIEWNIALPDTIHNKLDKFWRNADNPNDPATSYSLKEFYEGMFKDGNRNKELKPNYILQYFGTF